jgi:catechol 2,3-dioxygenase-like lactoylglutathione lyase family enzyme
MIRGVHHVSIATKNFENMRQFYRDILGFEEVLEVNWDPGMEAADRITDLHDTKAKLIMVKAGNACIELIEYKSPQPKPGDPKRPVCDCGIAHICLDVIDVDDEYERLKAAGMAFHCPPLEFEGFVRTTYGRDPDGNVIEIQQFIDTDHPSYLSKPVWRDF